MNWRIVVGGLMIVLSVKEFLSIVSDYRTGKLASWPVGVEVPAALMVLVGMYLVRRGLLQKKHGSKKL